MANHNQFSEAPPAKIALRTFMLEDWRWEIPAGTRIRMKRRVSAGMPQEMREAVEATKEKTGLSMSEIVRRCLKANLIDKAKVSK